jgi:hypothetical protein
MKDKNPFVILVVWYFVASFAICAISAIFIYGTVILLNVNSAKYDCAIAPFSPDIPTKVKQACLERKK